MKLTRYRGVLFAVAAITAVLSSCSSSTSEAKKEVSPFVGNWMRVGDGLEGLIIEIKEKDSTFTGFVVDAPVNVKDLFPVGEEKWLELKQDDSTKVTGRDVWKSEENGVTSRSEYKIKIAYEPGLLRLKGVKDNGVEFSQQFIKAPIGKPSIFRSKVIPAGEGTEEQFDICLYDNVGYVVNYSGTDEYEKAWFLQSPDSTGNLSVNTLNAKTMVSGLNDWAYLFKGKVFGDDSIVGTMKLKSAAWAYDKMAYRAIDISLNGTWHYEEWGEGPYYITLALNSKDDAINGTINLLHGDNEADTEKNTIANGSIVGNKIHLESVPKGDFAMKYIFDGNVLQNSDIRGQLARKGEGDDGFVSDEMTFVPKSRYKSAFK